jgi:hypothetical protein
MPCDLLSEADSLVDHSDQKGQMPDFRHFRHFSKAIPNYFDPII